MGDFPILMWGAQGLQRRSFNQTSMNLKRLFMPAALVALACSFASQVQAIPFLAGDLVGAFRPDVENNVTITNFTNGNASFRTGIATSQSFKSGVSFTGESFTGLGEGETISLGSLSYYNGITQIGTSSHSAVLDLYLRLTDPTQEWLSLGTINFTIDSTVNTGTKEIPDNFLAEYFAPAGILLGDDWLQFTVNGLPAVTAVAENSKFDAGNLSLTLAPSIAVFDGGNSLLLVAFGLLLLVAGNAAFRRHHFGTAC